MAQVPEFNNKVQTTQGTQVVPGFGEQKIGDQHDKEKLSGKLKELRSQAGGFGVSSELKSLIEFLEGILGEKAPESSDQQKLEYLTQKIKERSPEEQISILKEINGNFKAKKGSGLEKQVNSLKKELLGHLKELAKNDKNTALITKQEKLGPISLDSKEAQQGYSSSTSFVDEVQAPNQVSGMARKPLEKSLDFMKNFAEHQQGFFEDSAFKISEFAGTSDKSKQAYKLMREADKFWQEEKTFLGELKDAGKSRDNNDKLQIALRDLLTLEMQMGSRFDADFANIEKGNSDSDRSELNGKISEKKSEIKALHSSMGA